MNTDVSGAVSEAATRENRQPDYQADYVIVGAGSAGCVLANRLSANPNNRVLLLEAGGRDDYFWIHIPVGYLFTINNKRTDWCYSTEPDEGLNGRSLGYPRGRVLGGCSSINGMIYMRGQARDYDHWRDLGNDGWGWQDVLPYFKKSEDHVNGPSEMHGAGGEWRVENQRLSWPILDAFRAAATENGIPANDDFNTGDNYGVGYFHVNQKRGRRWSTARGFLKPVLDRPNLTVVTDAHATRLEVSDKQIKGIHFRQQGRDCYARADREVLLSAGAVSSPVLMQRSGIGASELLQQHGIETIHELPGVGENLQDHLQVRAAFKVKNTPTLNERSHSLWGRLTMGLEYFLFKRGPLTMSPSQLGGFVKSDPSQQSANLEYHIQPLSCEKLGGELHRFPAFTASVCNLRPKSRGHVHLRSADPLAPPVIKPNYLSHPQDRQVAADALKLTRTICKAPALAPFEPEEFKPGVDIESDEELARAAGDIATTIFHPVGTCKMGDDPMAVVDARLRVHGLTGLRVVDASIMPTITSGNTNSPVVMIAEKAADMILEDNG